MMDRIELVRKDMFLMAKGTTLGADNGIAVATNLAIMEDRSIQHGPLELLFTVDEETGLTGANNLKPGFLSSKIMINLDSEEEGSIYVGCSGGRNTIGTWKRAQESAPRGNVALKVIVKGLKGGHSGLEIDKGRGNSIKIINRVIIALEAVRTEGLTSTVDDLIEEHDVEAGFHFGELKALGAVRRQDLRNYFRNEAVCGCDERYRETFPDLLLGPRKEMPFDEAVSTIRRGEPDNWGNLFDELKDLKQSGAWPPPHDDANFWSPSDAR